MKNIKMHYVSDIHLNHFVIKKFNGIDAAPENIVGEYIRDLAKKMIDSSGKSEGDYLLLAGDVSHDIDRAYVFYEELTKHWKPSNIIAVLGNHDLWDLVKSSGMPMLTNYVEIIARYRPLFKSLGINFLQNELLAISEDSKIKTLDLLNVSPGSIKEAASDASLVILGGLGFSGLNKRFNATQGIYRGAVLTLEEDAKRSLEFEKAYRKVNDALETSKVICLTHNPKSDWTNDAYNRNWIYVSGHTHQNFRCVNSNKTVYSNNQIGYYASGVALKCFEVAPSDYSQMQLPEN